MEPSGPTPLVTGAADPDCPAAELRFLITRGAKVDGTDSLCWACRMCDLEKVKVLLDGGADVNAGPVREYPYEYADEAPPHERLEDPRNDDEVGDDEDEEDYGEDDP